MYRFVLLLGCVFPYAALAQYASSQNPMLLGASHPSVYLQYDREGERSPNHPGQGDSRIWLRVHSNTRAVCIRTQSLYIGPKVAPLTLLSGKHVLGIRNGIEIAPFYSVQQEDDTGFDTLPLTSSGDVSALSWIASGGTVLMSIPKEYLAKTRRIALRFSYEWEAESDDIAHEAFFYAREVPSQGR